MNEDMNNLEKLVYYVNIFNSIDNLDDFKNNHMNDFSSIVRRIHFGYKKLRYENPEFIEDAKKVLMSIIDVHPNLENWINSLVNRNNDLKLHDLFKHNTEKQNKIDELKKSIDEGIKRLESVEKNMNDNMTNLEKLKNVVDEFNSIEDIWNFKKENEEEFAKMIQKILFSYNAIKKDMDSANELLISIKEKHVNMDNFIDHLINGKKSNDNSPLKNEDNNIKPRIDTDKLMKSIDEKIAKLEKEINSNYNNVSNNDNVVINDDMSDEEIINTLRKKLAKPTTIFKTGGIRPTYELGESWIGKVCFQKPDETIPKDANGNELIPIATIFLNKLPYVPKQLENIKLITIFLDEDIWNNLARRDLDKWFVFRTYNDLDNLVPCNYVTDRIKAFPLVPEFKDDDFPVYEDLEDHILKLVSNIEKIKGIDYYDDIVSNNYYNHKVGGYPSAIQGGVGFDNGCEFVLQIASDEKANFNIVHSGNFYIGYNPNTKAWGVVCDFY